MLKVENSWKSFEIVIWELSICISFFMSVGKCSNHGNQEAERDKGQEKEKFIVQGHLGKCPWV